MATENVNISEMVDFNPSTTSSNSACTGNGATITDTSTSTVETSQSDHSSSSSSTSVAAPRGGLLNALMQSANHHQSSTINSHHHQAQAAAVAEYYNDLNAIIARSSNNSSVNSVDSNNTHGRILTPISANNNNNCINLQSNSQTNTPHIRDSPFFFATTEEQGGANLPVEHRRFLSTVSNDDRLLNNDRYNDCQQQQQPGTSNGTETTTGRVAGSHHFKSTSMVAIDFSVLARNSPATVGGLKSTGAVIRGDGGGATTTATVISATNGITYPISSMGGGFSSHHTNPSYNQLHSMSMVTSSQHHPFAIVPPTTTTSSSASTCPTYSIDNTHANHSYSYNNNGSGVSHYVGAPSLYSTGTSRSHEEDIYEDLCYVTLRPSRERDKALGTLLLEPIEKRDYCIKELVETEKNYCEALRMIINHFYKPLSKILHSESRKLIFNNLRSLTDLHTMFYNELYRACSSSSSSNISNGSTTNSTTAVKTAFINNTASSTPSPTNGTSTAAAAVVSSSSSSLNSNLIPSTSMPCLMMSSSAGVNLGGAVTNSAYVGDFGNSLTTTTTTTTTGVNNNQNLANSSFSSLCSSTSTLLLPSLACASSVAAHRLSNCFLAFKDKFLIYGEYCANLPKAQALLDDLCARDVMVSQCVACCQNKANDGKFKLRDLLSLPMQRILKYHLLLGELIRSTAESHEDFEGLKLAHDAMLDIGGYINEVKRDTESLEIIRDVQRSIVDLSMPEHYELKDYGRLLKDGELRLRSHDDPRMRLKHRYVFVFDKVVLMCKQLRGVQYSYKEALILEEYKLEELCTASPILKLTKQWSHGWSLVNIKTRQTYSFFVKSDEVRRKWLEAIERAQDNVKPKELAHTDHRFTMSTVPVSTYCVACCKLLRGTWYQGYLCTVCQVAVHKACITTVKPCGTCGNVGNNTNTILVRKDSLVSECGNNSNGSSSSTGGGFNGANNSSSEVNNNNNLRNNNKTNLRPNITLLNTNYRSMVTRSVHGGALPPLTPSRSKRIVAKAIGAAFGGGGGQLAFMPNDTIIVYAKQDTVTWYGRNVRTDEEGTFSAALVTELVTDSPASSQESPIGPGAGGPIRFCYEDPFGSLAESLPPFHTMNSAATLPRKFSTTSAMNGSTGVPSPQSILIPSSPLAASTPTLNQINGPVCMTSTANNGNGHNSGTVFNFSNLNQHQQSTLATTIPSMTDQKMRLLFGNGYNLDEYAWYAGQMDRERAQKELRDKPAGTFLVRISPKQKNNFAISLNYNGAVKHMRVCVTEQPGILPTTAHSTLNSANYAHWPFKAHYYLSETRYFRTIVDLVQWYEMNSLSESFHMVNSKLQMPYKLAEYKAVLGQAMALYAFSCGTSVSGATFLTLQKGDCVIVVNSHAQDKGWWKGQIGDRVGYFPFQYVQPTSPDLITVHQAAIEIHRNNSYQMQPPPLSSSSTLNHDTATYHQSSQFISNPPLPPPPLLSPPSIGNLADVSINSSGDGTISMVNATLTTTVDDESIISSVSSSSAALEAAQCVVVPSQSSDKMCSPSVSPSSLSSASSSPTSEGDSEESPTTLSSPVNSDTSSVHSRQASSDAGIEVPPFTVPGTPPPPPLPSSQPPPLMAVSLPNGFTTLTMPPSSSSASSVSKPTSSNGFMVAGTNSITR